MINLIIYLFKRIFKRTDNIKILSDTPRFIEKEYKGYKFIIPTKKLKEETYKDLIIDQMRKWLLDAGHNEDQVYFKPDSSGGCCYSLNKFKHNYKLFSDLNDDEYVYSNPILNDRFIIIPEVTTSVLDNLKTVNTFLHELAHLTFHNLDNDYQPTFVKEFEAITYSHYMLKHYPFVLKSQFSDSDKILDIYIEYIEYFIEIGKKYFIKHLNKADKSDLYKYLTGEHLDYIKEYTEEYEKFKQLIIKDI